MIHGWDQQQLRALFRAYVSCLLFCQTASIQHPTCDLPNSDQINPMQSQHFFFQHLSYSHLFYFISIREINTLCCAALFFLHPNKTLSHALPLIILFQGEKRRKKDDEAVLCCSFDRKSNICSLVRTITITFPNRIPNSLGNQRGDLTDLTCIKNGLFLISH